MPNLPLVLGITGGSGAAYAVRLLEVLLAAGREVHLAISDAGCQVLRAELGVTIDPDRPDPVLLLPGATGNVRPWGCRNLSAGIASGSFRTGGMAIVPCSMSSLGAIAHGMGTNLVQRAAEVHLKERRKLVLCPRETPLHLPALENMAAATRAGAVVLPLAPGFYTRPQTIADLVDFVVARIADQLDIPHDLGRRWGSGP